MPARSTRRGGKYSSLDHEVMAAIFSAEVLQSRGQYEELLRAWEERRDAAIREQEEAERLRKEAKAEIAAEHEKLEARKKRFQALVDEAAAQIAAGGWSQDSEEERANV